LAIRGFKTKIALNVSLLLLISAVVTYALVNIMMQSVMVRSEADHHLNFLKNTGIHFLEPAIKAGEQALDEKQRMLGLSFEPHSVSSVLFVDEQGLQLYRRHQDHVSETLLDQAVAEAVRSNQLIRKNIGMVWASFWYHPRSILIALPIEQGQSRGAAAAIVPLEPVYHKISQYNRAIFIYIVINTCILTLVGLYRIFRLYLKPIDRIVRQADAYHEDDDVFFAFRREDDELNRLSSALNRMFNKIKKDKTALEQAVASLELANRELQKAQNDIIRAEKMASVGRLAAGIAHEIGNPVGIVLGYLELLKQTRMDDQAQLDYLQRAEKETQRINTIIRQLLDLARNDPCGQEREISIKALVSETIEMLRLQPVMADIKLQSHFETGNADAVHADPDQLRQVFLNLLLNAADAIAAEQSTGRIDVFVDVVTDAAPFLQCWMRVRFQDNGTGVPAEHIENIFDPFFTTKEPGKGTGLGLSVSYMIVQKFGGTLAAESEPGKGTTLTVLLPLIESPAGAPRKAPAEA
jgi:signal transduction histidine kinase